MTPSAVLTMRTFRIVWIGQLVSVLGSGLTTFAIPIWVFLETRSVTTFALISLVATLPALLLAPAAGALIDRWDRRLVMMGADTLAGVVTLVVAVLFLSGALEIWHLYVAAAFMSLAGAFQGPAYLAAVPQLVPKERLSKANGQVQLSQAIGRLVSPALAGTLLATIGLGWIMVIDVVSFLVAVGVLAFVRFPVVRTTEPRADDESFWSEALAGWRYLRSKRGMVALLFLFAGMNFLLTMSMVLFSPMMLAFTTEQVVGLTFSISGVGMLLGSVVMSTWEGARSKVVSLFSSIALAGAFLVVTGSRPTAWVVTLGLFGVLFAVPIASTSSAFIWQTKVPLDLQGRTFSIRTLLSQGATPLSYVLAGPLIDGWLDPLLAEDGALAGSVGSVIGVGPGRGIGLLFVVAGIAVASLAVFGLVYEPVRHLERNHPDVAAPPDEVEEPEIPSGVSPPGRGGPGTPPSDRG